MNELKFDNYFLIRPHQIHVACCNDKSCPIIFRCAVDKRVVRMLNDRTLGNTVSHVLRVINENHSRTYLSKVDMYTTLLKQISFSGGIASKLFFEILFGSVG